MRPKGSPRSQDRLGFYLPKYFLRVKVMTICVRYFHSGRHTGWGTCFLALFSTRKKGNHARIRVSDIFTDIVSAASMYVYFVDGCSSICILFLLLLCCPLFHLAY